MISKCMLLLPFANIRAMEEGGELGNFPALMCPKNLEPALLDVRLELI